MVGASSPFCHKNHSCYERYAVPLDQFSRANLHIVEGYLVLRCILGAEELSRLAIAAMARNEKARINAGFRTMWHSIVTLFGFGFDIWWSLAGSNR